MALLVSGKDFMTSENFEVYLQPLVQELQQLWIGVAAYDVLKPLGSRSFTLRASLLWTIHDFPGYGIVVGVSHQGYNACPIWGPDFRSEHFVELKKMTYICTCRWLPDGHPYRLARMKGHFNGQLETRSKPKSIIAKEQLETMTKYQSWLKSSNRDGGVGDRSEQHGVKLMGLSPPPTTVSLIEVTQLSNKNNLLGCAKF
jgi:hypothetical protein